MKKYINAFKDTERKSLLKMSKEIVFLFFKEKSLPVHYFTRLLYKKEVTDINYYLSLKDIKEINSRLFTSNIYSNVFENKLTFHQVFSQLNYPTPITYGFIASSSMFLGSKKKEFSTLKQLNNLLSELSNEEGKDLFLKPIGGMNGKGCISFSEDKLLTIDDLEVINNEFFIIQEKLIQHPLLADISKNSINTIRINTVYDGEKAMHLNSILRFGLKNRVVDNGGAFLRIVNGCIVPPAFSFLENGGNIYSINPNSNLKFKKLNIPFYQEALDLVLSGTEVFPGKIIGWDIAITIDGPVIIEANHNPHLGMADIAYGGLKRSQIFRENVLKN